MEGGGGGRRYGRIWWRWGCWRVYSGSERVKLEIARRAFFSERRVGVGRRRERFDFDIVVWLANGRTLLRWECVCLRGFGVLAQSLLGYSDGMTVVLQYLTDHILSSLWFCGHVFVGV